MKNLIKHIISKNEIGKKWILSHHLRPYLDNVGWYRSFEERLPVDREGDPIPWFTYSAISFLNKKINSGISVFEYGSGNSTLWWAQRAVSVETYEHDFDWYNSFKEKIPANVNYNYCKLDYGGAYCQAILKYKSKFDIIVIDGRDRVNCAKNSLGALKENGTIIFDNTDRAKYREGYDYLLSNGFKSLDFEGLRPINCDASCTSIFYRVCNYFDI
jgi:hypothetical protein